MEMQKMAMTVVTRRTIIIYLYFTVYSLDGPSVFQTEHTAPFSKGHGPSVFQTEHTAPFSKGHGPQIILHNNDFLLLRLDDLIQ